MPFYLFALNFFYFFTLPPPSLCKHSLVDGNQSQLLALTCVFHFSVAFMSDLLPGKMQSGARMEIIYLTGGETIKAPVF